MNFRRNWKAALVRAALLALVAIFFAPLSAIAAAATQKAAAPALDAPAVEKEFERMAAQPLWPNFDPLRVPLAIFDGKQTWLFRHPSPPPGYHAVPGNDGARVLPGRDPAITANTSDNLGGVPTAMLLKANYSDVSRQAAVMMHEAFHVFQRAHHADWSANEAELFLYPMNNAEVLQARRLETESLRRALAASGDQARCWARAALDWRSQRFAKLTPGGVEYERRTELNEGLAQYVEDRAAGKVRPNLLPVSGFAIDAVRSRGYSSGEAIALLLDRFNPSPALTARPGRLFGDWQEELDSGSTQFLDQVLARRLAGAKPCEFEPAEKQESLARAQADVAQLQQSRQDMLRDFHHQAGWRVVIESAAGKLGMQGFDPLNVTLVGNGLVLHSRFLKAGADGASIEILGTRALTEAAGAHPAFSGFRRITVAGFAQPPRMNETPSGAVAITAPGLKAEFAKASVQVDDAARQITISF